MLNSMQANNTIQNPNFGMNKHVRLSSLLRGTPVEGVIQRNLVKLTEIAENSGKKLYFDAKLQPELNINPTVLMQNFDGNIMGSMVSYKITKDIVVSSAPRKSLIKRALHFFDRTEGAQKGITLQPESIKSKNILDSAKKVVTNISA